MEDPLSEQLELAKFEHLIANVYAPLLTSIAADAKATDTLRNEFIGNLQKFATQISHTIQQVSGEKKLNIPNIRFSDPRAAARDDEIVAQIEAAVEEWTQLVQTQLEREAKKTPRGNSPLAEIEFWRDKHATFNALHEQLNNQPAVRRLLDVLELLDSQMLLNFRLVLAELTKHYNEAKDNVKFLSTLERHFKNLATGSFATINDTLPSMMNAIRMVWIISRYYNRDECMTPLLERIAWQVADRVADTINVKRVLREADGMRKIQEAKQVLERWKAVYFEIREKIEQSESDDRWEFDRKRLFDQTDYMAERCEDLFRVALVLEQFRNILGPELKAVTGEAQQIDDVLQQVDEMVHEIEQFAWDVFDKQRQTSWESVMAKFDERVVQLEQTTRTFIDASFNDLRSAEGAFDLLQNFKNLKSRASINQQMMDKFSDVLKQYSIELHKIRDIFREQQQHPPCLKNQPPVAGAISWSHALFHRIKKPIVRFKSLPAMLQSELGQAVSKEYVTVGRQIRDYEAKLFASWSETVDQAALAHLKQPILLELEDGQIAVNFPHELVTIMRETKYLDHLGFKVPEPAMAVTLQEEKYVKYVEALNQMLALYSAALAKITPAERPLLATFQSDLRQVLAPGFKSLNWHSLRIPDFIKQAEKEINKFSSVVNQVQKNASMIESVIESVATAVLVPPRGGPGSRVGPEEIVDMQEWLDTLDKHVTATVAELVRKYRTVPPLLGKIEGIIETKTVTLRSPRMASYYKFCEVRMFNALNRMVLLNLHALQHMLNLSSAVTAPPAPPAPSAGGTSTPSAGGGAGGAAAAVAVGPDGQPLQPGAGGAAAGGGGGGSHNHAVQRGQRQGQGAPLLQLVASLSAPEVVMQPTFNDVMRLLNKVLKLIVESAQQFVRWMDGTCVETPPQQVGGDEAGGGGSSDEEPVVFSFYTDLSANPQVIRTMLSINQAISRTFQRVSKYLDAWRRYKPLWKSDKVPALERFALRNPSVVDYDTKLAFYAKLGHEVESLPTEKDVDFVRVSCVPLESAIKQETAGWLQTIGKLLHQSVKQKMIDLNDEFSKVGDDLSRRPDTMDDLKFILNTIAHISSASMEMEMRYADIEERYRTLQLYSLPVPADEHEMAARLRSRWLQLLQRAKQVDETLVAVKAQFCETTKKQVEQFKRKVSKLKKNFQTSGPGAVENNDMDAGLEQTKKYEQELKRFNATRDELVLAEKLFSLPITPYPELVEIEHELEGLAKIYSLYSDQKETVQRWSHSLWAELDIELLSKSIEEFVSKLKRFPPDLKAYRPYQIVAEQITSFRDSIPLFRSLKSDALRPRHWKTLMEVTGQTFQTNSKTFTLESVFKMELFKYAEKIEEIVGGAAKELSIEEAIQKIADTWRAMRFEVQKYTKGVEDRGYVLKSIDEIQTLYDDNAMSLQSMSASRFVAPFVATVQKWEKTLSLIAEVTEVWMLVQRKWIYLENIFIGSDDIRLQLPDEAKRFDRIDKTFKKIMTETAKNTLVLEQCTTDRLDLLKGLSQQLETCQKSLSEYLLTKRNSFPRFFFISDDELLSIIGSQDPETVQEHVIKLYDNVLSLHFSAAGAGGRGGQQGRTVGGMDSSEHEKLDFKRAVPVEGAVENWMSTVEKEMKRSLQLITKEAIFHYPKMPRLQWIYKYQGMVVLSSNLVWWTWEVEDRFRKIRQGDKYAIKAFSAKLGSNLTELVTEVRKDLADNDRRKLNALIIVDVHARDVIDRFVRDSILDERDFGWESQLRYYWDKQEDDMVFRQATAVLRSAYEFLGLSGRLVITPLTERCIMTLTQALSMRLGGAPAGPAGTGKTETVKDLAKALGLQCVVFNCSEGLDYATMSGIFCGLVQSGAWGCFDEFNRIDAEVLSVVSVQIKTIQIAMKNGAQRFQFEGNEISLDQKAGIFITMNPHYAGRTELPDNLKALFRPVVMIVPDLELICEIMLFSEGFTSAKILGKKMCVLYSLLKEQLSKQAHYDFGLRTIKAVLVRAGVLKRLLPDQPETITLVMALTDMNVPRFVFDDVPLFNGLIGDLFPGIDVPPSTSAELYAAAEAALKEHSYMVLPEQVNKVIQLNETMKTRHTSMVVGPTGSGKSVIIEALARAQTALGWPTKLYTVNPKAQSVNELYGVLDPNTRDWTDGLLSNIFREINQPSERKMYNYIVLDGDVDPVWVENMNSVMDDNKLLTLPNGERIRLQKHCALLFEVAELKHASPATVSRCGMVYTDPRNLGFKPYYVKWSSLRPKAEHETLRALFDKYVPAAIAYIFEGVLGEQVVGRLRTVIPITSVAMVKQLCTMLTILLTKDELSEPRILEALFIFALLWSLGAVLVESSRKDFDAFLKKASDWTLINNADIAAKAGQLPTSMPTLYDYFFDTDTLQWTAWAARVEAYRPPPGVKFHQILVPTVDTVRNSWLLQAMLEAKVPLLFVGESGTAKTAIVNNVLAKLKPDKYSKLNINFSSRTTSIDVQRNLESNVERWTKGTYGPAPGKQLVVFVDDLNMPVLDKYETQQPIALLKLVVERNGLYDRGKELNWKNLRNVQWVCAMAPPGGGRNVTDPRFVSMFNVINIPPPTTQTLSDIFSCILSNHLEPFHDGIKEVGQVMTDASLQLYTHIVQRLPPTPSKFHYIFNLRDLSRIYEGLCMTTLDKFDKPEALVRLWRNEALRVFYDRLITTDDAQMVADKISAITRQFWPAYAEYALAEPLVFGNYKGAPEEEVRVYEDYNTYDAVRPFFEEQLLNYNEKFQPMNLVLFEYALEHLGRVLRIMRRPRGNCLLVGIAGSGKQSLTRLAAFVAGYQLFEIKLARNYGDFEFKEDIKKLYHMLGVDGKDTVFLFTDSHVAKESFMETINNMLTTGMVPALYADDEKDGLINIIRDEVVKARIVDSKENCWNYFCAKCADKLHIALCMSPGETLRVRCRNYPGLVNNCAIDWFHVWPKEALFSVANAFLREDSAGIPPELVSSVVEHVVSVHQSVSRYSERFEAELRRHNYLTPKNFLDYISKYIELLRDNKKRLLDAHKRFDGGLKKLVEAAAQLDVMNVKLQAQKVIVDEKARANEVLLTQISENKSQVQAKQALASAKERDLSELQVEILSKKQEAEEALAEALPAVEAAREALSNLNKADITELRSFATPHKAVQAIASCVCILMKQPDISWKGAKGMMASTSFLKDLLEMNADAISEKQVKQVKDMLKKNTAATSIAEPEAMRDISIAGAGLMTWVLAIVKYCGVSKQVAPKRKAVEVAMKQLSENETDLDKIKREVGELAAQLQQLEDQYAKGSAEQNELREQADLMERRLVAAAKLIGGLGTERVRWAKEMDGIEDKRVRLTGDCLLASAFLSYGSPFNFAFRREMMKEWEADVAARELPLSQPFDVSALLTDQVEVSRWASEGLPSDELSIQNGILTTRASRFPLCIDPQQQAFSWIMRKEAKQKLIKRTFLDADFAKQLELSISFGVPMLIEGVDEFIDPLLDPVLDKNIKLVGSRKVIQIGDKEVDWNDQFRLYMTTKVPNPNYTPRIFAKTLVLNYNLTLDGLQEQLLNTVVGFEQPELEQRREALIIEMSENRMLLKNFEDTLLRELANSTGNMLDNHELISTLENTKAKAVEIADKLELAKSTSREIERLRDGYRSAAKRGAVLYFVLAGLSSVDTMYQYALSSFMEVFRKSLVLAPPDVVLNKRLKNIIDTLTTQVYNYTCLGLFERHKLMMAFQLAVAILQEEGLVDQKLLDFFLRGNLSLEKAARRNPYPAWLPERGWQDLQELSKLGDSFAKIVDDVEAHEAKWKQWYDLDAPEDVQPPLSGGEALDEFKRMLVVRCFRTDRIYMSLRSYVVANLGEKFTEPPIVTYQGIFELSAPATPVIFILSPGADPGNDVRKLADQLGMGGSRLKEVALGQGQGPIAVSMIEFGISRGHWVMLHNCHLLTSWLRTLEKLMEKLDDKPHKEFRLFLTTEPTEAFPIGILQRSLKVVTEPPNGLKLNMTGSYSRITHETLSSCPHPAFSPLVYVTAFFHAVVQERRKYGKVGWNVPYDFNESDFNTSLLVLNTYLTKSWKNKDKNIPWSSLRYLIGEVIYGGRVTDGFDRRTIATYLDEYMGDYLFDTFQKFHFYKDANVDYRLPEENTLEAYNKMIESLPAVNTPTVLGLHSNAEIGYYTEASTRALRNLMDMQVSKGGASSGGDSREAYVAQLAKDIESKLPDLFDLLLIGKQKREKGITPTQVVLLQELERFNALLRVMKSTLRSLQQALVGEIGMNNELEDLEKSLLIGSVPNAWRRLSPPTQMTLPNWLVHFKRRHEQYAQWVVEEPIVMWLSGLHVVESYMKALMQVACRQSGWALDGMTLFTKVTNYTNADEVKQRPETGCYVQGLFMEGAAWDYEKHELRQQDPKQLVVELPIIQIVPIEQSRLKLQNTFKTPVYVTQERNNKMGVGIVFEADLPSGKHSSHWVLQGTCLLLQSTS